MGIGIELRDEVKFKISRKNIERFWTEEGKSIEQKLEQIGYEPAYDEHDNIVDLTVTDMDSSNSFYDILTEMAPYIEPGSFLEFEHEGGVFRALFDGEDCDVIEGSLKWSTDTDEKKLGVGRAEKTGEGTYTVEFHYLENGKVTLKADSSEEAERILYEKLDKNGLTDLEYRHTDEKHDKRITTGDNSNPLMEKNKEMECTPDAAGAGLSI